MEFSGFVLTNHTLRAEFEKYVLAVDVGCDSSYSYRVCGTKKWSISMQEQSNFIYSNRQSLLISQ